MKEIRDAIHGNIKVDKTERRLLDTRAMQRLRNIKQLGFTYLVYPGANHTRFEHSLGVMHLIGRISNSLGLHQEVKEELRVAGLLHDIGHGPFSHTTEMMIKKVVGMGHEEIAEKMITDDELGEILEEGGYKPENIADYVKGEADFGEVLHSELDADRMDYLMRDSYYTGVAYGMIDLDRLISTLATRKHRLVLTGGIQAAEALLRARFLMYPTVYEHHAARVAEAMFSRALDRAITNKVVKAAELYELDDVDIISRLRGSKGYSKKIIDGLDSRDLFKSVIRMKRADLGDVTTDRLLNLRDDPRKLQRIEAELAQAAGIGTGEIIVDVPAPLYQGKELELMVRDGDDYKPATQVSVSIRTLEEAQWDYWELMVVCPDEHRKAAEKAVNRVMNIRQSRALQKTLEEV